MTRTGYAPPGADAIEIDDSLSPGDTLTITVGSETFSVVQYNPFVVGPFQATTTIRKGETPTDAALRTYRLLEVLFRHEYDLKAREHNERIREATRIASDMKKG